MRLRSTIALAALGLVFAGCLESPQPPPPPPPPPPPQPVEYVERRDGEFCCNNSYTTAEGESGDQLPVIEPGPGVRIRGTQPDDADRDFYWIRLRYGFAHTVTLSCAVPAGASATVELRTPTTLLKAQVACGADPVSVSFPSTNGYVIVDGDGPLSSYSVLLTTVDVEI